MCVRGEWREGRDRNNENNKGRVSVNKEQGKWRAIETFYFRIN